MPYRRLPNTDSARIRAMRSALERGREIPPFKMAFSQENLVKLHGFLPQFEHTIGLQRQTMTSQSSKSGEYQELTRKARLYISHFLRVMNMAIHRGELPAATRTFYGIAADDQTVPSLTTDNEIVTWGKRIIDGEDFRKKKGLTSITNPSIAIVKVWYDQFIDAHRFHKTLNKKSSDYAEKTAEFRREADELILSIWNQVEAKFKDLSDEKRRKEAEKYGLVYVFRKNEVSR
ncbi:MAG: hypothetical protein IH591_08520 [Bacteroidales bacterium]|nr:hypothetical protein [Bacteroidales bacterium]